MAILKEERYITLEKTQCQTWLLERKDHKLKKRSFGIEVSWQHLSSITYGIRKICELALSLPGVTEKVFLPTILIYFGEERWKQKKYKAEDIVWSRTEILNTNVIWIK